MKLSEIIKQKENETPGVEQTIDVIELAMRHGILSVEDLTEIGELVWTAEKPVAEKINDFMVWFVKRGKFDVLLDFVVNAFPMIGMFKAKIVKELAQGFKTSSTDKEV